MENVPNQSSPLRVSEQTHRKQFFWQILLPILLAVLAAAVIGVLAVIASGSQENDLTRWAMIGTILLVLPWLILSLIPFALLVMGIWLMKKWRASVLPYLATTAHFSNLLSSRASGIAHAVSSPIIHVRSAKAGLMRLFKMAFRFDTTPKE